MVFRVAGKQMVFVRQKRLDKQMIFVVRLDKQLDKQLDKMLLQEIFRLLYVVFRLVEGFKDNKNKMKLHEGSRL